MDTHASHHPAPGQSATSIAIAATLHCLTGCAIGEILGLAIATALGWHDLPSILLAIVLAFAFGYGLTMRPLLASGMPFRLAMRTALTADTASIVTMEVVDSAIVLLIPVNRWLIVRGRPRGRPRLALTIPAARG